jgi:hypothetical protein
MKRFGFPLWVVLTAFTLTCILALSAHAQQNACSDHPACEAAPGLDRLCRVYLNAPDGGLISLPAGVIAGQINDVPRATPTGCNDPRATYALAGWRYNMRGGAKLQQMTFLQGRGGMQFALATRMPENTPMAMSGSTVCPRAPDCAAYRPAPVAAGANC